MSNFCYTFESRYSLDTYEDVINTYEWLSHCFEYVFLEIDSLRLSSSFSFSASQIDYECSSIDEFKENAFGLDIKPETLFLSAKDGTALFSDTLAHFWVRSNPEDKEVKILLSSVEKKIFDCVERHIKYGTKYLGSGTQQQSQISCGESAAD